MSIMNFEKKGRGCLCQIVYTCNTLSDFFPPSVIIDLELSIDFFLILN